jgi:glutathione S-transferase
MVGYCHHPPQDCTMKLYYSPGACSLSPHIVLHESGLPFTGVVASTKTKKLPDGTDFLTINELGYVPVLELDNGERLREGPAIVQYLADQVPGKNLAPANGTMERYRLQEWLTFIGTELHKGHSPLFAPGTPEDYKPQVRERLQARFAWVNQQLAGKDYLLGSFSVADAYLYTVSRWGQYVGVDLSGFANIVAFQQRMGQRPAVQAALRAEGLLK